MAVAVGIGVVVAAAVAAAAEFAVGNGDEELLDTDEAVADAGAWRGALESDTGAAAAEGED